MTSHLVLNICTCMSLCVYLNTNGRASFQSLAYVEAATFIVALHTYVVKTPIPHSCALFVYKVPGEWSVQHLSFIQCAHTCEPLVLYLLRMKRRVVRQLILLQKRTMERISVQDTPAIGEAPTEKKALLGGPSASEGMCCHSDGVKH